MEVEVVDISAIKLDPNNYRTHPEENIELISNSVKELGFGRSIVIDENNMLIAGEGATRGSINAGIKEAIIIDADGDQVVAVRRRNLSPENKERLKVIDNRANETSEWNNARLAIFLQSNTDQLEGMGFSGDDLQHLLALIEQRPPSLDDIANNHNAANDASIFSKVFTVTLPLPVFKRFEAFWQGLEGKDDKAKAVGLMKRK